MVDRVNEKKRQETLRQGLEAYPKELLDTLFAIYEQQSLLSSSSFEWQKQERLILNRVHYDLVDLLVLKENLKTLFPKRKEAAIRLLLEQTTYYAQLEPNYSNLYQGDPNQLSDQSRYYYAKTLPILQQKFLFEEGRSLIRLKAEEYFFGLPSSFYQSVLLQIRDNYPVLIRFLKADGTLINDPVSWNDRSQFLEVVNAVKQLGASMELEKIKQYQKK